MGLTATSVTRRTLGGVKVGSLGIPLPLVVNMPCRDKTIYGSPPTFTATVNKSATITFYLDNVLQPIDPPPPPGLSAPFTPNASLSIGEHKVRVVATSGDETKEKTCTWEVEPELEITLDCPGPTAYGFLPTFTATVNKSAKITFYLGEEEVDSSTETTTSLPYTPKTAAAIGTHVVKATAISEDENEEDSKTCSWTVIECKQPDDSPFLGFTVFRYRCCSGEWKDAVCTHNALINLARNSALSQWQDQLENCYWKQGDGCPEYPFITSSAPTGKDLYYVSIESPQPGFVGHAVVGELIGDDPMVFENWEFSQYGDLDIKPGNPQMPYGYGSMSTTVTISQIIEISVENCEIKKEENVIVVFKIDNLGNVQKCEWC